MKLKRRIFLKSALVMASIMTLSKLLPNDGMLKLAAEEARKILQGDEEPIHIVWVHSQSCSGDSVALLNATDPSIIDVLIGQLKSVGEVTLDFHQTLSPQWGVDVVRGGKGDIAKEWDAVEILEKAKSGEISPMLLVLEGAFPNESNAGDGYWSSIGSLNGEPIRATEWLQQAAKYAAAVVAIGTCAAFGGIPAGTPNPTGAKGVYEILGKDYKSGLNLPVVNVPGCPAAGDWQTKTFAHLLLTVKGLLPPPELDEYLRPVFLYRNTVHERCGRGIWYSSGKFSKEYSEPYCMYELGCKGPIVNCPITTIPFVEGVGICTEYGSVCIGCTDPRFPDAPLSPFLKALPAPAIPIETAAGIAAAIGAVLGTTITYKARKVKKELEVKREVSE